MDYIEGLKRDQMIELLTKIAEMMEYDLGRKYPDLKKQPNAKA
jgi:hypothetical protein